MSLIIQPKFELFWSGSAQTSTKDDWFDIMAGSGDSPIPNGTRLWLGICSLSSDEKALTFEIRPNNAGESTFGATKTTLKAFTTVPAGDSRDLDLDFFGNIQTLAPILSASTGVEKLWLRVRSGSMLVTNFSWLVYYTRY